MAQDDLENDIEEFDNQEDEETSDISGEEEVDSNNGVQNNSRAEARELAERDTRTAAGVHTPNTFDECDVRLLPPLDITSGAPRHEHFPPQQRNTLNIWEKLFPTRIMEHILQKTNERMVEKREQLGSRYKLFTMVDLKNFLTIYIALSLVHYREMRMAWMIVGANELFGSEFIQSTMSRNTYLLLHRNIQADLQIVNDELNAQTKAHWKLGTRVSFDDDLVQSTARSSQNLTIRNPRKAGKRGISSIRIVDDSHFCYHTLWETFARKVWCLQVYICAKYNTEILTFLKFSCGQHQGCMHRA